MTDKSITEEAAEEALRKQMTDKTIIDGAAESAVEEFSFYQALVNGQFTGRVQFKPISIPGTWLGDGSGEADFPLVTTPTEWDMRRGEYRGTYHGHNVDIVAYWIYSFGKDMCWQAENYGGARLKHWHWDGHPVVSPEDMELFTVEAVSEADQTVRIHNAAYGQWVLDNTGSADFDPHTYISLVGHNFACNATKANAIVLQVIFG
jgi:hypothetical protein